MKNSTLVALLLVVIVGARLHAAQPPSPFDPADPMQPRAVDPIPARILSGPDARLSELEAEVAHLRASVGQEGDIECGCNEGCCDCGPCGNPCCFPCGWYGGAAVVWAKPYFEHNTAYSEVRFSNNPNIIVNEIPFDYDFEATPRLWIGYENECGFGGRIRYWQYDHQAHNVALEGTNNPLFEVRREDLSGDDVVLTAQFGDTLTVSSSLELHVVDFEATQRFMWCRTEAQVGFGVRYLRMNQEFFANLDIDRTPSDFLFHKHNFDGAGPTIALDLRRPNRCGNLALIAGVRAAVLFGQADEFFAYEEQGEGTFRATQSRSELEVMAVGEAMFGIEYRRQMACCAELFIQGTLEGQIYHGAGNAVLDTTSDLGFLGLGLTFGIHR